MVSAVMGVLGAAAAAVALVVSGAWVRRALERDGSLHAAGPMPAGERQEEG